MGAKFGKTLVMNRCVKYFISIYKLSKSSFINGWRSTSEESLKTVKELFNCIIRDTDEWKELLKALFFGVEIRAPKAQLKRKSPKTSHDGAASILEHPVSIEMFLDCIPRFLRSTSPPIIEGAFAQFIY